MKTPMISVTLRTLFVLLVIPAVASCAPLTDAGAAAHTAVPVPKVDAPLASRSGNATAVLAGGCFWGMQWVFEHVPGVVNVTSGYSGGAATTAAYGQVSEGDTGHAEAVRITYDPSRVTYGQLLRVYFSVATDPTELDRQGPDTGTQYRGVVFYADPEQQEVAKAYIAQLGAAHVFARPIVTQLVPLKAFYPAENYHQDYARLHPDALYIAINDAPKVAALQRELPDLYRAQPVVWHDATSNVITVDLH
ncbi:MAG TPA: peptide-methionine (S)-S-oxide reductase MsrA [Rhodanobacteraceae bacterium]|jgi:peptide-methionine (S)-S-oxide reductase|nr:peptide-methionine (S)-S-oxide reductase MsrA [Rhodanobacteraceae bacterium]